MTYAREGCWEHFIALGQTTTMKARFAVSWPSTFRLKRRTWTSSASCRITRDLGTPATQHGFRDKSKRLGELLNIRGRPDEKKQIWPIIQVSDWGERVPVEQVEAVLDFGSQPPATGLMVFHWG